MATRLTGIESRLCDIGRIVTANVCTRPSVMVSRVMGRVGRSEGSLGTTKSLFLATVLGLRRVRAGMYRISSGRQAVKIRLSRLRDRLDGLRSV